MTDVVTVDAGDARLRVIDTGSGEPVVVLHGFTGSAEAMAPIVDGLADRYRMIVPALVGHGGSSVPHDQDAFTVGAMVRHVLAVADVLGCATFHLVGYSMGGRVALTLGCEAGHRLRSLTLLGATPGLADPAERAERRRADESRAARIESDFEGFVDDWMAQPLFSGQSRLGPEHLAAARAQRLAADPAGLARSLRAAGLGSMPPLHDRLGRCTAPTLLIVGEDDHKFVAVTRDLTDSLPRSSVAVIERAGHSVHLEAPAAVISRIHDFVAALEGS